MYYLIPRHSTKIIPFPACTWNIWSFFLNLDDLKVDQTCYWWLKSCTTLGLYHLSPRIASSVSTHRTWCRIGSSPIRSMYLIFTYIYLPTNQRNCRQLNHTWRSVMGHQKVLWWGSAKVDELGILERQVTQPSPSSASQVKRRGCTLIG